MKTDTAKQCGECQNLNGTVGHIHHTPSHTPTPWKQGVYGRMVYFKQFPLGSPSPIVRLPDGSKIDALTKENAAYIVKCVNENEQIKSALKSALADSARLTLENTRLKHAHEGLVATLRELEKGFSSGTHEWNLIWKALAQAGEL